MYPFRYTTISQHRKKTLSQKIVGPNRQQIQTKDESTEQSLKKDVLIIEKKRSPRTLEKKFLIYASPQGYVISSMYGNQI